MAIQCDVITYIVRVKKLKWQEDWPEGCLYQRDRQEEDKNSVLWDTRQRFIYRSATLSSSMLTLCSIQRGRGGTHYMPIVVIFVYIF